MFLETVVGTGTRTAAGSGARAGGRPAAIGAALGSLLADEAAVPTGVIQVATAEDGLVPVLGAAMGTGVMGGLESAWTLPPDVEVVEGLAVVAHTIGPFPSVCTGVPLDTRC